MIPDCFTESGESQGRHGVVMQGKSFLFTTSTSSVMIKLDLAGYIPRQPAQ
jgi:hypothetical protein